MADMPLYALLIGIDCYMPNRLPDGSYYKNLGGCVRDIDRVEAFLKDVRQVPATQILKLTATPSPEDDRKPVEAPEHLPTRNNIIDSFRALGEMASPGSQVYIHCSSHGGRVKTIFEAIKGVGEIDEGLVPTDIGTSEGQYIRDLELAHLLQELANKDLTVTIVLDCCHSGGATRGDAEIRGMSVEDDKPLQPHHKQVASLDELKQTWTSLTGTGTRGLKAGGLPESKQYVVLAACRQNEYAYEYAFNRQTGERSGALTHWFLDTLRQPNPGRTYKDLYDRINAQIHSQFPSQTPLLLGAGDRLIFGSERGETVFAVPVMKVEATSAGEMQAILQVGQANGITKGAEFVIYPRSASDLTQKADRIAIARVIQRGGSESLCKLEAIDGKELKVEPGDQAVQIAVAPSLVKKVSLFVQPEATADELQQPQLPPNTLRPEIFAQQTKALDAIKTAIQANGKGWVELDETAPEGDNGELINFIVAINNSGEYEICPGGSFEPFKNITPPLKINDATAPEKLVKRLIHLAKYQAAMTIDNVDPDSPLTGKLAVEWLGTSETYDRGDPIPTAAQLKKFADPTKPMTKAGEFIFLSIRNNSTEPLNVAVLNFESDWAIEQIYPGRSTENFITLEPGKQDKIPLQLAMEGEGDTIENTIKVFATKDQANFRWLELPSLDEKIVPKVATRSGGSPLDALLAAIGEEQPKTRKLIVAASPSREWTTKQLTLTITK
jgi:hypothetical protein